MGNFLLPADSERHVLILGLERAGKTHLLYTRLVGEGGMHTTKNLGSTLGCNFEQVEETQANLNVWDVGGNEALRAAATWKQLYLKHVPISAIIYVVNVCEDMERLRESRLELIKVACEPIIAGGDCCNILALVYNNKPNLEEGAEQRKAGAKGDDQRAPTAASVPGGFAVVRSPYQHVDCALSQDLLDKLFGL
jgi:hypothetical protein